MPKAPTQSLPIETIRRDAELTCRARGTDPRVVAEYAEAMRGGAKFPAIVVFRDSEGVQWLADGFHRVAAAESLGATEALADVREGARLDALKFAASANDAHGLRRSNADKRRAIALVLKAFPDQSSNWVAQIVGVDHKTVEACRPSDLGKSQPAREGADGKRYRAKPAKARADKRVKAATSLEKARSAIHKAARLLPEIGQECERLSEAVAAVSGPLRSKRTAPAPAKPEPKPPAQRRRIVQASAASNEAP